MLIQSLQKFRPVVISDSMTYSAPQADSITYEAPQVPVPSDSVAATEAVIQHPPVAVTAEEFMKIKASVADSLAMTSQSITYEAPQAPVPSESVAATGKVAKVVVYPAVTITAEDFANMNGSTLTEPLPVTEGFETVAIRTKQEAEGFEMVAVGTQQDADRFETVFAGAKREVDFDETEAVDETVKIKKKSKRCCC